MYWSPRLAEICHLTPRDLADMTYHQIHAAHVYAHPLPQ